MIIPAESVYAVFEVKQEINPNFLKYAMKKAASARKLHRTSLPIPHAGGTYPPKPLIPILGGILALDSTWNPALGQSVERALTFPNESERLDFGCVAAHGNFYFNTDNQNYDFVVGGKPATQFLYKLIATLQFSGTVPMIDVMAYAQWLNVSP